MIVDCLSIVCIWGSGAVGDMGHYRVVVLTSIELLFVAQRSQCLLRAVVGALYVMLGGRPSLVVRFCGGWNHVWREGGEVVPVYWGRRGLASVCLWRCFRLHGRMAVT